MQEVLLLKNRRVSKEVNFMPLRLKALVLLTGLCSIAAFLADWGWNP